MMLTSGENFDGYTFTRFDGTKITVYHVFSIALSADGGKVAYGAKLGDKSFVVAGQAGGSEFDGVTDVAFCPMGTPSLTSARTPESTPWSSGNKLDPSSKRYSRPYTSVRMAAK